MMRNCALIELAMVASAASLAMAATPALDPGECDDCKLLATSEDASCSDFDPVVCKAVTSATINDFPKSYSDIYDNCQTTASEYCNSPANNANCLLDEKPDNLHLELNYNEQFHSYGVKLTWPTLNSSCISGYYVLEYNGPSAEQSKSCEYFSPQSPGTRTCYVAVSDGEFLVEGEFGVQNYVTFKVVAYPAYVWTISYKVDSVQKCLARCGKCACPSHSAPTNLTWSQIEDESGSVRLSWDSDQDSTSVHYLHLNSSVSGKLLYLVHGTESSVLFHNLTGNVTAWMESYNADCGCSNNSNSQVLLIDTDTTTQLPVTDENLMTTVSTSALPLASTTSATVANPLLPNDSWIAIVLPLASVLVILLVAVVVIITGAVVAHHRQNNTHPLPILCKVMICADRERKIDSSLAVEKDDGEKVILPVYKPSENSHQLQYVLLVFSQETPVDDQPIVRAYAQQLNKKVRVKMYDVSDRLTRTAWLEEHHQAAVAILCVCNQAFAREWSNSSTPSGGSIVSAVRMIVQGKIEHQKHLEKFAVLHLHKKDVDFTPSYLKNVKSFLLNPEQIDCIAHFALSVKEFDYQVSFCSADENYEKPAIYAQTPTAGYSGAMHV